MSTDDDTTFVAGKDDVPTDIVLGLGAIGGGLVGFSYATWRGARYVQRPAVFGVAGLACSLIFVGARSVANANNKGNMSVWERNFLCGGLSFSMLGGLFVHRAHSLSALFLTGGLSALAGTLLHGALVRRELHRRTHKPIPFHQWLANKIDSFEALLSFPWAVDITETVTSPDGVDRTLVEDRLFRACQQLETEAKRVEKLEETLARLQNASEVSSESTS